MPVTWLVFIVLALALAGFVAGRVRIDSAAGAGRPHSLPNYYGWNIAIKVMVPAFLVLICWLIVQPFVVNGAVTARLGDNAVPDGSTIGLVMSDVRRVAEGLDAAVSQGLMGADQASDLRTEFTNVRDRLAEAGVALGSNVTPQVLGAAQTWRALNANGMLLMSVAVTALALAGLVWGYVQTTPDFRARNTVENALRIMLLAAASLAILTTIGIVFSLIGNTIKFFSLYPASEFFGSFTWSPSFGGGSELGIWPLLWGTLYISVIALTVAVPIGLFAAVYLSEYAGPRMRAWAKPMLEVLAGIPTIVYGLFALLTVGPLLLSVFGRDGLGWMQAGTAVMTAGLVMGIMLIPFVSSLSDDIINAVPQSLRDGSYGLGATKSETIKQVILPAALPGIVGAILLAASRAIGETMIVVLGAGAAARLSLNPFDAMTTVTAKIVSQLTGDADFASPEALVAFALGMTLFVMTLGLNVFALYIVRKYREQYE
ncbi:ABC transporter permease [Salipiger aestuarii]|uniref:Phosphate transport system permease protein n=3 Tax=Salipiger aestuarii TaxID=568098 RepID=A0A327XM74_9RHOB|nr:phosphate ABC transporter permease subunit PstC [Salipiger aestuarii]EIE52549.1 phosphate ABC transporter, inner membrane subunit PstC [Citreicella sp. 357]KAB2539069.1 ABC transporter permease [Salipiger aestuarii]RAK09950.1 phosphate ABC transporter membrane protein 1 (PhoT family) [Salipiger aestuarii]